VTFPYVPVCSAFREVPILSAAFSKLRTALDLISVAGRGFWYARRFGVASHLGVVLDWPTIGCAKFILVGERPPIAGRARRKERSYRHRPESEGRRDSDLCFPKRNRVSLNAAVKFTLAASDGYRVPRPSGKRIGKAVVSAAEIKTGGENRMVSTSRGGWGLLPIAQQEFWCSRA
jgi:deoxyribonuclease V